MSRRDAAGWLLTAAAGILPPRRRGWGTAMQAELAGIGPRCERWRFTLGCVRVVATRPAVWRHAGYPLLMLGVLVATVRETARIGDAPLHWGLVGLVGTLVLVAWLGRVGPLGPVAYGRAARGLRAGGYLLVGALTAEAVVFMAHRDNHDVAGVPVFTVLFVGYLLGFLALTAQRSAATTQTLITGIAAGGLAAAGWTAAVAVAPPIPPDPAPAVALTIVGMAAAGWAADRRGGAAAGLLAGACAGTVAALLILNVLTVLSTVGPARLIPNLAPRALGPADQLANSRIEIQDPYLWLLLFGWLIAIGQCVMSLTTRRPAPAVSGLHGQLDLAS